MVDEALLRFLAEESEVLALGVDEGVGGAASPLTAGHYSLGLDEGLHVADEVGLPFGSFRDGMEGEVVLLVIDFVLDDEQQPLVELEKGLYFCFVLLVHLLLFLDLLQHPLDTCFQPRILLHQPLHEY